MILRRSLRPDPEDPRPYARGAAAGASLVAVLLAVSLPALADFAIGWHTMDAGGGKSHGERFAVSGTIGQPDAGGLMTGGRFAATGGFWPLPVLEQMPGAPVLRIHRVEPGQITLSWSPATPGWVLQESPDLTPDAWVDAPSGATNPVNLPISHARRFYRLRRP